MPRSMYIYLSTLFCGSLMTTYIMLFGEDSTNFPGKLNGPRQDKTMVVDPAEEGNPSISVFTDNGAHQVEGFRVSKYSSTRSSPV